jgi:hypothetical protein
VSLSCGWSCLLATSVTSGKVGITLSMTVLGSLAFITAKVVLSLNFSVLTAGTGLCACSTSFD